MRKYRYIFIFSTAGILFLLGLILNKKNNIKTTSSTLPKPQQSKVLSEVSTDTESLDSKTKTFGAVEVEVIPKQLVSGKPAVFHLSLNTHSVDLDYNYTKIVSLTDDLGNVYKALSWNGKKGGHHLKGELIFEPLKDNVKSIMLELSNIDGDTHGFSWSVNAI